MSISDITFDVAWVARHMLDYCYPLAEYYQVRLSTTQRAVGAVILIFLGAYWTRCLLFAIIDHFLPPIVDQSEVSAPQTQRDKLS